MTAPDYIARAKAAQQKYDERPGTQLSLDNPGPRGSEIMRPVTNPNHDDDPGDCTDHRGS